MHLSVRPGCDCDTIESWTAIAYLLALRDTRHLFDESMTTPARRNILAVACLATLCPAVATAAFVTDATSFQAFSVSYDMSVWGPIKFAVEADAFSGKLPVRDEGFGRFFLDPGFSVSSDGSAGPPERTIDGSITLSAKPGWGIYHASLIQSGQWSTTSAGSVSVEGSTIDITAKNAQFFFNDQRAFVDLLSQDGAQSAGYYYILGERSSMSRFDEMTIDYSIHLRAGADAPGSAARLAADSSDPIFLGGVGPYPASNVVGTLVSASFSRVAAVPEPQPSALLVAGLAMLGLQMNGRRKRR